MNHHHRKNQSKKSCRKLLSEDEARILATLIVEESTPKLSAGIHIRKALLPQRVLIEPVF
jgi:hypothetical protein